MRILAVLAGPCGVADLPGPRLSAAERRLFTGLRPMARARPADSGGPLWPDWQAALADYRARLAGPSVTQDPAPVAQALVHMHCNRLAGLSPASERVAVALARDLAMTTSRPV